MLRWLLVLAVACNASTACKLILWSVPQRGWTLVGCGGARQGLGRVHGLIHANRLPTSHFSRGPSSHRPGAPGHGARCAITSRQGVSASPQVGTNNLTTLQNHQYGVSSSPGGGLGSDSSALRPSAHSAIVAATCSRRSLGLIQASRYMFLNNHDPSTHATSLNEPTV